MMEIKLLGGIKDCTICDSPTIDVFEVFLCGDGEFVNICYQCMRKIEHLARETIKGVEDED